MTARRGLTAWRESLVLDLIIFTFAHNCRLRPPSLPSSYPQILESWIKTFDHSQRVTASGPFRSKLNWTHECRVQSSPTTDMARLHATGGIHRHKACTTNVRRALAEASLPLRTWHIRLTHPSITPSHICALLIGPCAEYRSSAYSRPAPLDSLNGRLTCTGRRTCSPIVLASIVKQQPCRVPLHVSGAWGPSLKCRIARLKRCTPLFTTRL